MQNAKIKYWTSFAAILLICLLNPSQSNSQDIPWTPFEEALSTADSTNSYILVDVWAPWCGWCRKMEKEVYPKIHDHFGKQFVFTRLNRDDNKTALTYNNQTMTPLRVAQVLNVQEVPGLVLLNSNGIYLLHLTGFREASQLRHILNYIGSGAYRDLSFEEFLSSAKL